MKKFFAIIMFAAAVICCFPAGAEENGRAGLTKDVKILYTSDVHCAIDKGWGYGGIYAVKQSLAADYHVLLVDDGDAIQGEPVGLMTKGEAMADITRGGVTPNDILQSLPYGTKLDLVEVTGQQVLDILEWSVHALPEEFGGFEHVAGLTYEVDPDIKTPCVTDDEEMFVSVDETMPRRVRNVKIGEEEIDQDALYHLVTNDYILMDGDGFTMFRDAKLLEESDTSDSDALLNYITGPLGGVIGEEYADPYGQGRMESVGDE